MLCFSAAGPLPVQPQMHAVAISTTIMENAIRTELLETMAMSSPTSHQAPG
jgi:hypothetical protein